MLENTNYPSTDCPCFQNCPAGCHECDSKYCNCIDGENNPDFKICREKVEAEFSQCLVACSSDAVCMSRCVREFDENMENCPCKVSPA